MKNKKGLDILGMVYAVLVILIVWLAMIVLSMEEIGNDSDTKESYEVEATDCTEIEHYVTLSVEVQNESEEPETTQAPIETEYIEIEEIIHPLADRYKDIEVTRYYIDLMAGVVHHESDNQPFAGQRMVAEVILNRVKQGDMGGTTIRDVVYAKNQFFYVTDADIARANETNYQAVYAALNEMPITDEDVVYFALAPHNNSVFAKVGAHYFCRKY